MRQCAHLNARGTQCRRSALDASEFCGHPKHADPATLARLFAPAAASKSTDQASPHAPPAGPDRSTSAAPIQVGLPGVDLAQRAPEESKRQAALGQWFTPPPLAAEIAIDADVRGRRVLEPSAGDGAIVHACLEAGAECVIAVELDPAMVAKLRARFEGRPVVVIEGDFLALGFDEGGPLDLANVDAIAGNPPYDDGVDGDHLARIADMLEAFRVRAERDDWRFPDGARATLGGALLLRTVALHSGDRFDRVWDRLACTRLRPCADRVSFPPAGNVAAAEPGKIDVSIFRVCLRDDLPPDYEQPITWIRF